MDELGRTLSTALILVALFFVFAPVETTKWLAGIVNTYHAATAAKSETPQ